MFNVGDKVVYPMHGAGTIDSIDKKVISEEEVEYINISMPGGVKVMVPSNQASKQGLRNIISQDEVEKVFCVLETDETEMSDNWNKRYRDNMEKMKSGDIYEVADVVRNLSFKQKEKGLSTGEKKMLNNAKQILVSELVLVENTTNAEMEQLVDNKIDVSYKENRENIGIDTEIGTSNVVSKFIPFNVESTGTSKEWFIWVDSIGWEAAHNCYVGKHISFPTSLLTVFTNYVNFRRIYLINVELYNMAMEER